MSNENTRVLSIFNSRDKSDERIFPRSMLDTQHVSATSLFRISRQSDAKVRGTVLFLITSELLITDSIVVFHNCCSEQQTAVQRITGYEEKGVASERRPW